MGRKFFSRWVVFTLAWSSKEAMLFIKCDLAPGKGHNVWIKIASWSGVRRWLSDRVYIFCTWEILGLITDSTYQQERWKLNTECKNTGSEFWFFFSFFCITACIHKQNKTKANSQQPQTLASWQRREMFVMPYSVYFSFLHLNYLLMLQRMIQWLQFIESPFVLVVELRSIYCFIVAF